MVLGSLWLIFDTEEVCQAHFVGLALLSLVPDVVAYLLRFPAKAVRVYDWRPETGTPEEPLLDARELLEEFPACSPLELLCNLVDTQGYQLPADVYVDVVPVIACQPEFHPHFSCCFQQQFRAPFLELHDVEYIVAILDLEAHVGFHAENA